ncbi:CPBP family intramembrane glutamic endopeptidase [Pandoraea morbifera]
MLSESTGSVLCGDRPLFRRELGAFAMVCLIAPFVEEMLYRGIILRSFLRQYPAGTAIAHSAAVFGLAHLNVYQFVVALIIGLIIGKMYERTRSLVPGILLHMFYNTSVVVLTMHLPADDKTPSVFDLPAIAWLLSLASGGAGAFTLYKLLAAAPPTRANTARLADD